MTSVTRWWFVRHAPVPNTEGRLYGSANVACDTSDRKAFLGLARKLPSDAIWVTSHLTRTLETAAAIRGAGLNAPEPSIEPGICEQNFGDWQQLSWDEMEKKDPNILDLQKSLEEKTGLTVTVSNKKNNSGNITFNYQNLDQLDKIINIIKNNY